VNPPAWTGKKSLYTQNRAYRVNVNPAIIKTVVALIWFLPSNNPALTDKLCREMFV
jgi:hypothetical protein